MGKKHRSRRSNMIESARAHGYFEVSSVVGLDDPTLNMILVASESWHRPGIAVVPEGNGYAKVLVWTGHIEDRDVDDRLRGILRDALEHIPGVRVLEDPGGGYAVKPLHTDRARALASVLAEAGKAQNTAQF